jgi:hypothetical protein
MEAEGPTVNGIPTLTCQTAMWNESGRAYDMSTCAHTNTILR